MYICDFPYLLHILHTCSSPKCMSITSCIDFAVDVCIIFTMPVLQMLTFVTLPELSGIKLFLLLCGMKIPNHIECTSLVYTGNGI